MANEKEHPTSLEAPSGSTTAAETAEQHNGEAARGHSLSGSDSGREPPSGEDLEQYIIPPASSLTGPSPEPRKQLDFDDEPSRRPDRREPRPRSSGRSGLAASALQRLRDQPVGIIFFVIPLVVVGYVISLLLSGTSPRSTPSKLAIEPQPPAWDQPPVDDKPVDRDEVERLIRKSTAAIERPKEIRDPDYSGRLAKPPAQGGGATSGSSASDSNLGVAPVPPLSGAKPGRSTAVVKPKAPAAAAAPEESEEDADRRRRLERLKKLDASFFQDGVKVPITPGGPGGTGGGGQAREGQIQPGTTVSARLEIGVSTESQNQVVAKLLEPVKDLRGTVVLATGTTLTGTSRAGNDRVFLDFNRATTPTGMKIYFKGYAVSGKSPGIPAKVKGSGDSKAGKNLTKATVETAKDLADRIPGADLAGDFARHVARGTADDVADETRPATDKTLELAPGLEFQVVITAKE